MSISTGGLNELLSIYGWSEGSNALSNVQLETIGLAKAHSIKRGSNALSANDIRKGWRKLPAVS
jgi:hypothetical protein